MKNTQFKHPLHTAPLVTITGKTQLEYTRTTAWYIGAISAAVCIVGFCIYTRDWTFLLVTILLSGLYIATHKSPASTTTLEVYTEGIEVNDVFIPWSKCTEFWILSFVKHIELHIRVTKFLQGNVVLHIAANEITSVSEVLSQYIPYNKMQTEHFIDKIARILKI